MALRWAVVVGAVALLALASCSGASSAMDELGRVVDVERGKPLLVFVYTDG